MNEHPHAVIMRRAFAAFTAGDTETLKELIAEDAVWHMPGRSLLAGDYHGHADIFSLFWQIVGLSGGTIKVELHDALGSDEHGVNLDHLTAKREGKNLDVDLILVAHIREGKIVEAWERFSDLYAWDEFWS